MSGRLLALDLGTTTGYATGTGEGIVISGTWSFKPRRFDGGGMRYVKFRDRLDEIHGMLPITRVAFEEVRAHRGVDAAHIYGGLLASLTEWCERREIPYEGVGVGRIKKYATGKGNAGKDAVIEWARAHGYEPIDDNEADALALYHLVRDAR